MSEQWTEPCLSDVDLLNEPVDNPWPPVEDVEIEGDFL